MDMRSKKKEKDNKEVKPTGTSAVCSFVFYANNQ